MGPSSALIALLAVLSLLCLVRATRPAPWRAPPRPARVEAPSATCDRTAEVSWFGKAPSAGADKPSARRYRQCTVHGWPALYCPDCHRSGVAASPPPAEVFERPQEESDRADAHSNPGNDKTEQQQQRDEDLAASVRQRKAGLSLCEHGGVVRFYCPLCRVTDALEDSLNL